MTLGWAICCALGQDGPKLAQTKAAAEDGDAKAQTKLADEYLARLDYVGATNWYHKAANQGVARAQYQLGWLHKDNRFSLPTMKLVIAKDLRKSFQFFGLAANQNHAEAQVELGALYRDGSLVEQDYPEAYKWFSLAARQNYLFGITSRDNLILKINREQIAEGERRANTFLAANPSTGKTSGKPVDDGQLVLKAISTANNHSFAIINGQTFEPGDERMVKTKSKQIRVRCIEIRAKSVLVDMEGSGQVQIQMH